MDDAILTCKTSNNEISTRRNVQCTVLLGLALLCAGMTGILPQQFLSIAILAISVLLCLYDCAFLLYPVMIFYSSQLGILFGVSVYRLYTVLVLGNLLMRKCKNGSVQLQRWSVLPCGIYLLYCILVVAPRSLQRGAFALVDILCCALITANYLSEAENFKSFFKIYVYCALLAYITGLLSGNAQEYYTMQVDADFARFMATFEDPNYMGFFYTIAVFAVVTLKLFKPKLRLLVVLVLYAMILSSASITAIVANLLLWFVYLLLSGKVNYKTAIWVVFIAILIVHLYNYGLNSPDSKVLSLVSLRIQEKLSGWEQGDMAEVTTGRTNLSVAHLRFFWALPVWRQLIGGFEVNRYYISPEIHGAAHNEYVDLLLNVGILGTIVFIGTILISAFMHFMKFRKNQDQTSMFKFLCKITWIIYAAGLTIFLDPRFLLPFFF